MHYRLRYSLDFDLKIRSGQGWSVILMKKNFLTSYPPLENSTTCIAIIQVQIIHKSKLAYAHFAPYIIWPTFVVNFTHLHSIALKIKRMVSFKIFLNRAMWVKLFRGIWKLFFSSQGLFHVLFSTWVLFSMCIS